MNIGIDMGGSHIAVGLVDEKNNIIIKLEHDWDENEKEDLLKNAEIYSKKFINQILLDSRATIEKIGIGYPYRNIINGVIIEKEKELNLPKILYEEFNIPTYLKNDVKCSAICEKTIGNLKEYDNCIFITLGTGIGGAYFYNKKLVKPNKYQGFEIGHMVIDVDGKKCRCGRKGCFEEYASMRSFRKEIADLFNLDNINSKKMFEIIETKEKQDEVNYIIDKYIKHLAIGISNIINIFEPDAICIGGSFTYYAPIFMEKLKEKIKEDFEYRQIPDILVAKYQNDAGIIGASMLESN